MKNAIMDSWFSPFDRENQLFCFLKRTSFKIIHVLFKADKFIKRVENNYKKTVKPLVYLKRKKNNNFLDFNCLFPKKERFYGNLT